MTLPDERYQAILAARDFLQDLCTPRRTPRVPRRFRLQAMEILTHYPYDQVLKEISLTCPKLLRSEIDPVERMILKYDHSKTQWA